MPPWPVPGAPQRQRREACHEEDYRQRFHRRPRLGRARHRRDRGGDGVRLHWTDQPYIWHVNDGEEVFVVLDGCVEMQTRTSAGESVHELRPGDIFHAGPGDEHRAVPRGAARILVIERAGSV
jgi:mannose-6-phosphate isomerase-like protein (cupin superfamily)